MKDSQRGLQFIDDTIAILESHNLQPENRVNVINLLTYALGALVNLHFRRETAASAVSVASDFILHSCQQESMFDATLLCSEETISSWIATQVQAIPGITLKALVNQIHSLLITAKKPSPKDALEALELMMVSISTLVCSMTDSEGVRTELHDNSYKWMNFGLTFDMLDTICTSLTALASPRYFRNLESSKVNYPEDDFFFGTEDILAVGSAFH